MADMNIYAEEDVSQVLTDMRNIFESFSPVTERERELYLALEKPVLELCELERARDEYTMDLQRRMIHGVLKFVVDKKIKLSATNMSAVADEYLYDYDYI